MPHTLVLARPTPMATSQLCQPVLSSPDFYYLSINPSSTDTGYCLLT
nr:MAG TPA: holliday junction resolvase protein [Caudoviricetes sp.]